MGIRITEDGVVNYENQPDINRELFPNVPGGYASPEQITQAVDGWLEDHPEATTTVPDNSLTDAKFTEATQMKVLNDYVTPEMFGAVGDGTTDDTLAIQTMFASGSKKYAFGNKTYLINGSLDVTSYCEIDFNNTTFRAKNYRTDVNTYEYVFGIKTRIRTFGSLIIDCNSSVNIGLWLSGCGGSYFDHFKVIYACIWGICIDRKSVGNNGLSFNGLSAVGCGLRIHAKLKYVSSKTGEVTEINYSELNQQTLAKIKTYFDNTYQQSKIVVDDSGYVDAGGYLSSRCVLYSNFDTPFEIDENDPTKGVYHSNYIQEDYLDGENGRSVYILIGGGVNFGSGASEGTFDIANLSTQRNPVSFMCEMPYGGKIGAYSSEYDTVLIEAGIVYTLDIFYMYLEALGTGYSYTYGNAYDKLMLISQHADTKVRVYNPFIGTGRIMFYQANEVILRLQYSYNVELAQCLYSIEYITNKLNSPNFETSSRNYWIDEYSPRRLTNSASYLASSASVTLDLRDVNSKWRNKFDPFEYYIQVRKPGEHIFKVVLSNNLTTNGYSIHGSVDGVLSIDGDEYNNMYKVTIILFGKTFYVNAEPLTFLDNTVTNN